jgi:hypothetical protein
MLNLDSVGAKLERAYEHGRLLDQELDAWLKDTPYILSHKVSRDQLRHSVIVSILKPPPLTRWALLLGDAVHNMRSALDHLVYAISIHELKTDPPPNEGRCAFLINDTRDDFRSKHWRIRELSQGVREAIESVQPYNRKQHATMPPLLAVLRDFDDADKHRLIKIVLQQPTDINVSATGPGLHPEDLHFETAHANVVDGFEIASVTSRSPMPHLKVDCSVTISVAVEHAPGPAGHERRGIEALVLEDLLPEVHHVVEIIKAAVN